MAANQVGKTTSAGYEVAMHLTGIYPRWWRGRRFDNAVQGWAAGLSNEKTRDDIQRILMGENDQYGTGTIPAHLILKAVLGRSIANLLDYVVVRHITGDTSRIQFKAYEQGVNKFSGSTLDFIWLDEEPEDGKIYSECLARTSKKRGLNILTFTPLLGFSDVVNRFYPECDTPSRACTQMTIDDAPHFQGEHKQEVIDGYLPHEREARIQGRPALGEGKVFVIPESVIEEDPFTIPSHWPQIGGIDFGWDHPTACVWLAWDRDNDVVHLTHCYRQSRQLPAVHAAAMRSRGVWIPWSWPIDAKQVTARSGEGATLRQDYVDLGIRMLNIHSQFKDGSRSLELGVTHMHQRFQTQKLRVSSICTEWWDEYRVYHRKDGKIVGKRDDLLDATRYALMMLRFARADIEVVVPYDDRSTYDPMNPSFDAGPRGRQGDHKILRGLH